MRGRGQAREGRSPNEVAADRLIAGLRAGNPDALDSLLRELWHPLLRYATRLLHDYDTAQDLVQETFVRLWMRRNRLEPGSLRSYTYQVLHNLAVDELRKQRVRRLGPLRLETERSHSVPPPELPDPSLNGAVAQAIDALPARRRQAFVLAYLHRLSYREVGNVMGTSPATVKNQVAVALSELRETLRPLLAELHNPSE
jgi:RNA polymerase sigma-70 factor (ECF subfamily)